MKLIWTNWKLANQMKSTQKKGHTTKYWNVGTFQEGTCNTQCFKMTTIPFNGTTNQNLS
jgi:hypothetical protein